MWQPSTVVSLQYILIHSVRLISQDLRCYNNPISPTFPRIKVSCIFCSILLSLFIIQPRVFRHAYTYVEGEPSWRICNGVIIDRSMYTSPLSGASWHCFFPHPLCAFIVHSGELFSIIWKAKYSVE